MLKYQQILQLLSNSVMLYFLTQTLFGMHSDVIFPYPVSKEGHYVPNNTYILLMCHLLDFNTYEVDAIVRNQPLSANN